LKTTTRLAWLWGGIWSVETGARTPACTTASKSRMTCTDKCCQSKRAVQLLTVKTKIVEYDRQRLLSSQLGPNRVTRALPLRGSRDLLRLAEGGALPYEGAGHCPGFSLPACTTASRSRISCYSSRFQYRNQKPETRNKKHETRNLKFETRNQTGAPRS